MGFYPIFVEMQGRKVILVGGGHVALEKIGKLVDADADVTVVAPELIAPVREFTDAERARLIERAYEPGDIDGFDVVMIATDDGEVNRGIAEEARATMAGMKEQVSQLSRRYSAVADDLAAT